MSTAILPRLLTAKQLHEQLGGSIPLSRIYELSRTGDLPAVRFGRALRYDPSAVLDRLRSDDGNRAA